MPATFLAEISQGIPEGAKIPSNDKAWPQNVSSPLTASFHDKMGLDNQHIKGGAGLFVSGPRKITPVEGERLQGFPDGYTAILSDVRRYKALGNSMAVPVMKWLGERINNSLKGISNE